MKNLYFYKISFTSCCLIIISGCSFIYEYNLLIKNGVPDIEIVGRNPGSIGEKVYLYPVMILSDSNFIKTIDYSVSTATLIAGDSVFTAPIYPASNNTQTHADFRFFSLSIPQIINKKDDHYIELRFKSGDSIDYYYKFKNKN